MIDLNRGVTIRRHGASGMQVYMYKDDPGTYLDAYGDEVDEKLATQAGYDVVTLAKERDRKARIAEEIAKINAAYGTVDGGDIAFEKAGFKAVALMGEGQYQVVSPEGNPLTDKSLTLAEAKKVVEAAAKEEKSDG